MTSLFEEEMLFSPMRSDLRVSYCGMVIASDAVLIEGVVVRSERLTQRLPMQR